NLKIRPPFFKLLPFVLMEYRFPVAIELVRGEAGVLLKPLVYEFGNAIGASGPGECGDAVDKSAKFIRSHSGMRRFQPCRIITVSERRPADDQASSPRSRRIHSRTYPGQFASSTPSSSSPIRNRTTAISTRVTSLRSRSFRGAPSLIAARMQ